MTRKAVSPARRGSVATVAQAAGSRLPVGWQARGDGKGPAGEIGQHGAIRAEPGDIAGGTVEQHPLASPNHRNTRNRPCHPEAVHIRLPGAATRPTRMKEAYERKRRRQRGPGFTLLAGP
jgi:hypothetical protein